MKGSNIYDIDGELIRRGDQGAFTLEETEELVDKLAKKVQENPDNEVYKVYYKNAQKWLFKLYNEMNREDLMKRMNLLQTSVNEAKNAASEAEQKQIEEINKAVDELKKEYERVTEEGGELVNEVERPVGVNSLTEVSSKHPVEVDDPLKPEYVEFEEVNDGE